MYLQTEQNINQLINKTTAYVRGIVIIVRVIVIVIVIVLIVNYKYSIESSHNLVVFSIEQIYEEGGWDN